MILGALVDAGLPLESLERELRKLPISPFALHAQRVDKRGLAALYLDVDVPGEDGHAHDAHGSHHDAHRHERLAHRKLADVLEILKAAHFERAVEAMAEKTYRRLAGAEARVHGTTVEEIAFHEVGQIDAIVDIAGAAIGLHMLGIGAVYCSPLPCGQGRVTSAHGEMPSPAPATLDMLRDAPTYALDVAGEFVTPTGAAILTAVASFQARPPMTINTTRSAAPTTSALSRSRAT